ncbi:MAG: tetratricopeptide repeat protein [Bacteroidetes bacterium]|nr:tetratricopeptide repeat protein [Bacteroidota bacterium]
MLKYFAFFFVLFLVWLQSDAQTWREDYSQAQNFLVKENYGEAFRLAQEALRKYQEAGSLQINVQASMLRLLSTISYAQEKYTEGLEFVQKEIVLLAAQKDTTYAGALANQAQFFKQLNENDKAIVSLTECREVLLKYYAIDDFRVIEQQLELGVAYFLQNNSQQADHFLASGLKICELQNRFPPNSLEAYYDLGLVQTDLNKLDEALKNFERAIKLYDDNQLNDPTEFAIQHFGLAAALNKKGLYNRAEDNFTKAQLAYEKADYKTSKEYFNLITARAENLALMGKNNEAELLFAKIRNETTDPATLAFSLSNNAAAYQIKKDYGKAESLYREALSKYNKEQPTELIGYCETLSNLALLYSEKGDQTSAVASIEEAKEKIEKVLSVDKRKLLSILNKYALIVGQKGETDKAIGVYKNVLMEAAGVSPEPNTEEFNARNGLATLYQRQGKFLRADSIYQSILDTKTTEKGYTDHIVFVTLNNFAASKQAQGELWAAQKLLHNLAAHIAIVQGKASIAYANALENLAILNLKSGDLTNAKVELDSALLLYEHNFGKESAEYAVCNLNLGKYFQAKGDYVKAEPIFREARNSIQLTRGKGTDYVVATNALALLYQTLGNYPQALTLLTEERSILEKIAGKQNSEYSTCLQNLATLYQLDNKLLQAEPLLNEALAIDKQVLGENHPQYAIILQNLATLYQKTGRQADAQAVLEQALEITARTLGKEHPTYIVMLSNLATANQDQENFDKAEQMWRQSLELRRKVLGEEHPDYAYSLFGLAGVYHAQHRFAEAQINYEPVVRYYLKQIKDFFPSLSEKEKGAFYARIKPVFDSYQDFCVEYALADPTQKNKLLKDLYNVQLATKAILFNASNKVRARIQASSDTSLKKLYTKWIAAKEEIVKYVRSSEEERARFTTDRAALELLANDMEKKLSSLSVDFKTQSENPNVTWEHVWQNLQANEAAVEILRIKKRYTKDSLYYAALILKKGEPEPSLVIWPLGKALENRKFKYHRNTIKFRLKDTLSYRFFWQPLQAALNNTSTLFLSCDGVFNKVNFNSLYNAQRKKWVIDDYSIRQLSSTRELVNSISAQNTQPSAYLFGNVDFNLDLPDHTVAINKRSAVSFGFEGENIPALPATEKEIKEIFSLLSSKQWGAHPLSGKEASEEALKKLVSPRLIHIATHGFFLSDVDITQNDETISNPLFRSGVLLAGASAERTNFERKEDGVLTAYEAMNLNLDQTDLVVLSACETGLGEVRNGEGVYGLQRSFMVAGAHHVLMSLWQVDDQATQELMNAFYANWIAGKPKHQAFREAQLKIKEQYPAPYFWGAFVLIGN